YIYKLQSGAGSDDAVFVFDGEMADAPVPIAGSPVSFVCPADAAVLPAAQKYAEDGFDTDAEVTVLAAVEVDEGVEYDKTTGEISMLFAKSSAWAVLDFALTGDVTVASVAATTASDALPLAGGSHTVTLDCGDGVALDLASAKHFRMLVAPGTHAPAVRIRTDDGRVKLCEAGELNLKIGFESAVELTLVAPTPTFTSAPYKVGDYYFDGESEGVVVTVDPTGSAGKIISMHDMAEPLAWSTDTNTITEAWDEEDGTVNMAAVALVDESYAAYPAFKACAALGEGWYLPAQKELQGVRSVLSAVNETLSWNGGEAIAEVMYWSSTEAYEFRDAMAYSADMGFPGMFGYEKNIAMPVRAFKAFGEIPEAKYKVGTLCEENGMRGIVIWAARDDSYAKILSLAESTAAWGPVNAEVGAADEYDGEKNLAAVKSADASLADYPAFKACTEQGDGWYLPSVAELRAIAKMTAALNTEIAKAGGTPLQNGYYWSSTEYAADAANSAQCVSMSGSDLVSSKAAERNVRAVAYVGDKPIEARKYTVGEPYELGGEVVGVVFAVTDDGVHGKVVALKNVFEKGRINAMWDRRANASPANYVELGLTDEDDGAANMAKARENDPTFESLIAYQVCAALGEGWYIGAKNEMLALYGVKTEIDTALKANGGSALDNNDYWTSTEGVNTDGDLSRSAERQLSVNMKDGSTFEYRKYFYNLVRPIRAF
ncbi:MAG: DUF1566 domain-containing protein, partial [Alistipes sp.]|nr:DUF1566 domain-containing protein [Alistipes sp.]